MRATDGESTRAALTFWTVTSTSCPITTKLCPTILRSLTLSSLCTLTYRYNCEDMLCATLPVLLYLLVQLAEHFIRHLISREGLLNFKRFNLFDQFLYDYWSYNCIQSAMGTFHNFLRLDNWTISWDVPIVIHLFHWSCLSSNEATLLFQLEVTLIGLGVNWNVISDNGSAGVWHVHMPLYVLQTRCLAGSAGRISDYVHVSPCYLCFKGAGLVGHVNWFSGKGEWCFPGVLHFIKKFWLGPYN